MYTILVGSGATTKVMVENSEIIKFYSGKNILITGVTGFMGKVLLEKILRLCDDVGTIYLMIRTKKGSNKDERLKQLFESQAFSSIINRKSQIAKVVAIGADFTQDNLALSVEDIQTLITDVDVIIHGAATVNFNEKLKKAVQINVKGVMTLVSLAKQMQRLKLFIHVSTAYSFSNRSRIEEVVYKTQLKAEEIIQLVDMLDENTLDAITTALIGDWPNTYTFTKAMSEEYVSRGYSFPVAIVRPSVVIPAIEEPIPGWGDSLLGPMGIMLAFSTGLIRVMEINLKNIVDFMPVDCAINVILASGWSTIKNQTTKTIVYNCVSTPATTTTWDYFISHLNEYYCKYPSAQAIWYPVEVLITNQKMVKFLRIVLHRIPAKFYDFFAWLSGNPARLSKIYDKIEKHCDTVKPFTTKEYIFDFTNTKSVWKAMSEDDRKLFKFVMEDFDWPSGLEVGYRGTRQFLLKEDPATIPQAKRKFKILQFIHYSFLILLVVLIIYLIYSTIVLL